MLDRIKLGELKKATSGALGIGSLFRFQRYDSTKLALLLGSGLLRASDPRYFNDPFDCKPALREDILDAVGAVTAWQDVVQGMMQAQGAPSEELEKLREVANGMAKDVALRRRAVRQLSESLLKSALKQRIVCLAMRPDDLLLWAHYGDAHRGMCIEFNSAMEPFSKALPIWYEDLFPKLDLAKWDADSIVRLVLLTKAKCWEYEKEFRLLANDVEGSWYARCDQDLIDLPKGAVRAIHLGHKCTLEQIEEVRCLVRRFAPDVKLYSWVRVLGEFKIVKAPIDLSRPLTVQRGRMESTTAKASA
jgi:hypothetical protein